MKAVHTDNSEDKIVPHKVPATGNPLRSTIHKIDDAFEQIAVPMALLSEEGGYVRVNQKFCDFSGYTKEELAGKTIFDVTISEHQAKEEECLNNLLSKTIPSCSFEKKFICKTGDILWVNVTRSLVQLRNKNYFFTVLEDITMRKKYEEETKKTTLEYKTLAEHTPDCIIRLDPQLNISYANPAAINIFHLNEDLTSTEYLPIDIIKKVLSTEEKQVTELVINGDNYIEIILLPECDNTGKISSVLLIGHDITQKIKSTREIHRQQEILDTIFSYIPVGVWLTDSNGTIIKGNGIGEKIWEGAKYVPVSQLKEYKAWWASTGEMLKNEDWAVYRACNFGESSFNEILNIECFDGSKKTIINSAVPIMDNGKVTGVIVVNQDITDIKKMEDKLKLSIREKEVLIKEIHHRVKNNLQIISSIFNLQMSYLKEKTIDEIFREGQGRIKSMALVHEKLYKSSDLSHIDFKEYLNDLLNDLIYSHADHSRYIEIKRNIESMSIGNDQAIGLGLIINELVVNSLKHAFKGKSRGIIEVSLVRKDDNYFILQISDNGIGLPENFEPKNSKSLGMLLIEAMTEQLGGILNLTRVNGTQFTITFPTLKS